jgi:hypothetical protein
VGAGAGAETGADADADDAEVDGTASDDAGVEASSSSRAP